MIAAHFVQNQDWRGEAIRCDVPLAVLQRIQKFRPEPQQAFQAADHTRLFHPLFGMSYVPDPAVNRLGAMCLSCSVVAVQHQKPSVAGRLPNIAAELADLFFNFLDSWMPVLQPQPLLEPFWLHSLFRVD